MSTKDCGSPMADLISEVSLYMLQFRARLMHCHALRINGGLFDNLEYNIELQCNYCGETWYALMEDPSLDVEQWLYLMDNNHSEDEDEFPPDFEEQKCKKCEHAYWVRMIGGVGVALGECPGDMTTWGKMMQFECGNCTLRSCRYGEGWKWEVQLDGGVVQDIDLSTGYWTQVLDSKEDDEMDEDEDSEEEKEPKVAEISNFSLFVHEITTN